METQHSLTRLALWFCLLAGLILILPQMGLAEWERVASGIASGGVIPDIQTLDVPGSSADVVWAASMGTGLFRNVWDGDWDNDWSEYLPGKGFLGVDAIYHTPGGGAGTPTEYVLGGSNKGVWYKAAPITTTGWDRPNGDDYPHTSPTWWTLARIHDAAFYNNGSGYANDPQTQYFVILAAGGVPPASYNAGIYKWDNTNNDFDRVDQPYYYSDAKDFDHFYRDKGSSNILYVISDKLYQISGSDYTSLTFDDVDLGINVAKVYGMNQWVDGSDVHTYVLLRNDSGQYKVYHRKNYPSQGSWVSIWTDDDGIMSDVSACVVGKPHGNYHYLWLTASEYGVWFHDTESPNGEIQINGSDTPSTTPGLKRWEPRWMIPDFGGHLQTYEEMRLFLGTHHYGVWYLTSTLNGTWTHGWLPLKKQFYAAQNRDLRLLNATPDLPSGVYLARLTTPSGSDAVRYIIAR